MSDAPCKVCGYNGHSFYQPKVHPCPGNKNWKPPMTQPSDEIVDLASTAIHTVLSRANVMAYLDMPLEVAGDCARAAIAATGLVEENERLREHIREQAAYAETRIQDGKEMGAAIWRIALEDVVRENRQALMENQP